MNDLGMLLRHRPFRFEDEAEVGKTLSAEQWHHLGLLDPDTALSLELVQSLLRFYGNLSLTHRAALFSKRGMEMSALDLPDQLRLKTWIEEGAHETLQSVRNKPGKIRIMVTRDVIDEGRWPALFRAVFEGEDGKTTLLREQTVPDGAGTPSWLPQ